MNLSDINDKIDQIGNAWEHFKAVNDERLKQIEQKGSADVLTLEELSKINNALTEQKAKLEKLELKNSRPQMESKGFVMEENLEYKRALNNYLRKGVDANLANLESKSDLTTSIETGSSYGGYLLTPNMQKIIAGEVESTCIMRKLASVQQISSSSLDVLDDSNFETYWGTETDPIRDTNSTILNKTVIGTHELVAQPKVTQKLIDDSSIDIEEWLAYRLGEQFARAEEEAFIGGDGSNKPKGILNYTDDTIEIIDSNSTSGNINVEDIMDLYYKLDEKYVGGASFLMSRGAVANIRMLKDENNGLYLWQPALLSGKEDTLLGCPVYQSSFMPAPTSGSLSVILGDFRFYQIVDRIGIRILRDPYTAKPYVRFYTSKRIGGDVVRKEAFKMLRFGA